MALVTCPECGREKVSDGALRCPNCSFPIAEHFNKIKEEEAFKAECNRKYDTAVELMKSDRIADVREAASIFRTLECFKESAQMLKECTPIILDMEEKEREERKRKAELLRIEKERKQMKLKKIFGSIAGAFVLILVVVLVINNIIIPNKRYNEAEEYIEKGNLKEAYITLLKSNNQKSKNKINELQKENDFLKLFNCKAGDIVTFGKYEQDNNIDNGKEPIEWFVLTVENGKALVMSKKVLDYGQHMDDDQVISEIDLSENESKYIYLKDNETINETEAQKYFAYASVMNNIKAEYTKYAKARKNEEMNDFTWKEFFSPSLYYLDGWWISKDYSKSSDSYADSHGAYYVSDKGNITQCSTYHKMDAFVSIWTYCGIRPALWVKIA